MVRDIVIGMSDGLTVPFALAAGLSGAVSANNLIITAGLAEVAAGSIAMGLGGFLAAKTDAEHFVAERQREYDEIKEIPDKEIEEVADVLRTYGLNDEMVMSVTNSICADEKRWVDFSYRLPFFDPRVEINIELLDGAGYLSADLHRRYR